MLNQISFTIQVFDFCKVHYNTFLSCWKCSLSMLFTLNSDPGVRCCNRNWDSSKHCFRCCMPLASRLDRLWFFEMAIVYWAFLNCSWTCFFKYEYTIFMKLYTLQRIQIPVGLIVDQAPTTTQAHCNVQLNSDWSSWPCPHALCLCFIYIYASHCLEKLGASINRELYLIKYIQSWVCVCVWVWVGADGEGFGLEIIPLHLA